MYLKIIIIPIIMNNYNYAKIYLQKLSDIIYI